MTYGLGMAVADGIVLMADTRTNAGLDNISRYRKLHALDAGPGRYLALAYAGNVATAQTLLSLLQEGGACATEVTAAAETGSQDTPPGDGTGPPVSPLPTSPLQACRTLFQAVQAIGDVLAKATRLNAERLRDGYGDASVALLVAGRFPGEAPGLYLVYPEGNALRCGPDSPFLQIGELKYGKPILDRVLRADTPLDEAIKTGLLSFDAALRSNLSVGMPIDLWVLPHDPQAQPFAYRVAADDSYFMALSGQWAQALQDARAAIPDPPFWQGDSGAGGRGDGAA